MSTAASQLNAPSALVAAIKEYQTSLPVPAPDFITHEEEVINAIDSLNYDLIDLIDIFALVAFLKWIKNLSRSQRFDARAIVTKIRQLLVKLNVSLSALGTIGEWGAANLKRLSLKHAQAQAVLNESAAKNFAKMQESHNNALAVVSPYVETKTLEDLFEAPYKQYAKALAAASASIAAKFSLQCEESKKFYAGLAEAHVRDALSKA